MSKKRKIQNNKSDKKVLSNGLTDVAQASAQRGNAQVSQSSTLIKDNRYYPITTDRATLSYGYMTHGLVQTIVDVPVDDALRGGINISSTQLDEENITDLQSYLSENNTLDKAGQAAKWGRLFGGSGLIVNCGQKSDEKLDLNKINENTPLDFIPADRWELCDSSQKSQDKLKKVTNENPYNYYGERLHISKVLRFEGKQAPSLLAPLFQGWGMSEIERLLRSINQYLKNQNVTFECLDEAKLDIYKIDNLKAALMTAEGVNQVLSLISTNNSIKNFENALVLDKLDDYEQKQLTFAGLADIMKEIRIQIAADLRFPLTKLFGLSASGFNSGDDDIENYNSIVESEIRSKIKHLLTTIVQIVCMKLFGFIPEDLKIEFNPLRILTHEQEEAIKQQKFDRLMQLFEQQLITEEQLKAALKKENLVPIAFEA